MLEFIPTSADIVSELLTGALGGLVVTSFGLGIRIHRRRKLERRFPVAGRYISFFEDVENGERVVVPSRAEVTQRGSTIRIVNDTVDGRSWTLDGTILQGGHISGVYSADADYDEGVGSFYLRVAHNLLDGMWSGYDHANRMTTAGRYWFKRMLPVEINNAGQDDVNDILHTSGNAFGYGYTEPDQAVNDDTHYAIVARVDGEFAGFCFGHVLEADSLQDLIKMDPGIVPDDIRVADKTGRLGLLKTLAIRRKFKGHGIGTRLLEEAEKCLVQRQAMCIVVPAWKVGEEIPIGNLLKRADYAEWLTNESYWKAECNAGEFRCVARDGTCQCAVSFFRKGRL